jgi:hypothetical protein
LNPEEHQIQKVRSHNNGTIDSDDKPKRKMALTSQNNSYFLFCVDK